MQSLIEFKEFVDEVQQNNSRNYKLDVLKKYKENEGVYADDILNDFTTFNKKYCGDPNNILYIDKSEDYPSLETAIKAIKDCGGLVFMPHLFIYKSIEK